jgi:hypothetical protein
MNPDDRLDAGDTADKDDWLDELLRRDAAEQEHLANGGFAEAVMLRLPPPRRSVPRGIVACCALIGTLICLGLTPTASALMRAFDQLLNGSLVQGAWALVPVALLFVLGLGAAAAR